jgi:hypothetical protein
MGSPGTRRTRANVMIDTRMRVGTSCSNRLAMYVGISWLSDRSPTRCTMWRLLAGRCGNLHQPFLPVNQTLTGSFRIP